jgi:phosphate transport system ATP-binding protein
MSTPETSNKERTEMSSAGDRPATTQTEVAAGESSAHVERRKGHGVKVNDLNAYYGRQHSIKNVTIDFPANQVTAIIGPSGSGKSTVVRCINRMHEEIPGARAEGSVTLDELDVYGPGVDLTAVRRVIGMVFQKPNPFPTMSIFDNVAAGLRLSGTKSGNLRETVHKSLGGVVGRGQEPPQRARHRPVGRSAAAPVHRPDGRGGAGGHPDGRAVLGA